MVMNDADQQMEKAERDASPNRFPPAFRRSHEVERRQSIVSSSGSSISSDSVARGDVGMSRVNTSAHGHQLSQVRSHVELGRIQTARSQHSGTVGRGSRLKGEQRPMPVFGGGKPFPPDLPAQEEYVVEFDGERDPYHAQNWPMRKKIYTAIILGFTTFVSVFASSIFSSATMTVGKQFHVSNEVGLLGLSLYVLGFATGPIIWAPLSELKGRRVALLIAGFGFTIFQFAVATGKDLQTILICRFWGGFFGACPLAVVAAVFSDMFDNRTRGLAITLFSGTVFTGPLLAPFVGGFIVDSYLGWRWTEYLVGIMGAFSFTLNVLFLGETYPPVLLVEKASELRRRTKNWGIHAKQEEIEVDFGELMSKNFSRPLRILFTEPIVLLFSIYLAFVYGLLYLFLTAYPLVFQQIHGFKAGVGGLPFFGMVFGQLLAALFIILLQPSYNRKLAANNNVPIPEWRLPPVMVGGVAFAIGLFWFGWSGYRKDIHWIVPTLSGIFTGFGLLAIFLQSLNYIIDAYLMFAASAIAANTFLRSIAGAGFPMFSQYMFKSLGIQWAATLLGCVATLLVPIPIIFYIYGPKIREKSSFAPTGPKSSPHHPADRESGEV